MPVQSAVRLPDEKLDHQKVGVKGVDAAQLFDFGHFLPELPIGRVISERSASILIQKLNANPVT